MTFYLKPPRGLANVNHLESTALQRLKCYEYLFTESRTEKLLELECLIEDSVLDRLGHYLFRLVAIKSNTFCNSFVRNELKLLEVRLRCYSQGDVKYFVKKLRKHAAECLLAVQVEGKVKQFYAILIRICMQLLRKGFLQHAFKDHKEACLECLKFQINILFEHCPDLLASRQYNIKKGFLQIHCFQWRQLILSLYSSYLLLAVREMKNLPNVYYALQDERIGDVIALIRTLFYKKNFNKNDAKQGTFKLGSFDQESQKFPLCMKNLYGILQKNNRLSHNARFDFSLYLKGIGLSMKDALIFWESAYSKQHASCSRCTHSWQENEKRYIYGIRHLYGLEGSRKNYNVKSCHQIQGLTLAANEEGGCPFQHFDDDNLRISLKKCLPSKSHDQIEVMIYERKENAKKACEMFVTEQLDVIFEKQIKGDEIVYQDPAQYYLLLKSLAK